MSLKSYAGKVDGDHDSQVAAIEACIADGAKGILIAASDTKAIVDSVKKAQEAGMVASRSTRPSTRLTLRRDLCHGQPGSRQADRLHGLPRRWVRKPPMPRSAS